jgi:hypothetical protein
LLPRFSITEKTDGKKLCTALGKLAVSENPALVEQIIELERDLTLLEGKIAQQEAEMNDLVFGLYGLTEAEIKMVTKGQS